MIERRNRLNRVLDYFYLLLENCDMFGLMIIIRTAHLFRTEQQFASRYGWNWSWWYARSFRITV